MEEFKSSSPEETEAVGARLATRAKAGDIYLLEGELGAGKTTLVRGFLRGLGYDKPVKSPTFGILQAFETNPPVLHADLYRVQDWRGLGIEDYMDTHVCLVEWPDRAKDLADPEGAWTVTIRFEGDGRLIQVEGRSRVS